VAQAALLAAWQHRQQYRGEGPFEHWMLRIAHTTAVRAAKARQRQSETSVGLESDNSAKGDDLDELLRRDAFDHALTLLCDLPYRQMSMILWRYIGGYSIEEVAVGLRCSPGTVKAACHTGLKTLRTRMESDPRMVAGNHVRDFNECLGFPANSVIY
jgi:RNA polymerase sigma-70 factor (ECF subfamily)